MGSRRVRSAPNPRPAGLAPPAVAGNVAALVHGASSPRTVEPVACAIAEHLLAAAPYLNDPRYLGAVEALAVTEARLHLLDNYVNEHGLLNRKGRPYAAADYAARLERLAAEQRRELGLTPRAAAALGKDIAGTRLDLARQWSMQGKAAPEPQAVVPTAAEPVAAAGEQAPDAATPNPHGPAGADDEDYL